MNEEYRIKTIQILQATRGAAQYNTAQISKVIIANGLAALRNIPQGEQPDESGVVSALGAPAFPLYLECSDEYFNPTTGEQNPYGKKVLFSVDGVNSYPATPLRIDTQLIHIEQSKKTAITAIDNSIDYIVESSGANECVITIEGIITEGTKSYPYDTVSKFKQLVIPGAVIPVVHWRLNMFDIDMIIVKDFAMPQQRGYRSQQWFTMTAQSYTDTIVNVKVNP